MARLSRRLLVLATTALILVAALTGFYLVGRPGGQPASSSGASHSCADPLGGRSVATVQLAAPTTFGGVTEYDLPSPLMNPAAPLVAPDGSVWFAEQTVPGLAHFFPGNRTLVEYAFPGTYETPTSPDGFCGQRSTTWGIALWDGRVWAADEAGNQLIGLDPSTDTFTTVKLTVANSFPYTLTTGPNNTLWFTELYSGKIGEISSNGTLTEYATPGGDDTFPAQIVFANSTTGYYSAIEGGRVAEGGIYSFDVSHFSPQLVGGQMLTTPTSLTLDDGAVWVALHGSSSVASYNFTTDVWTYYPTTPVGYVVTTLPYYVNTSGTSVWLNEHYGNRMAEIDPANGTMVEYNEAPYPVNGSTIGNAVTFGVGDGRAWFAESTGNVIGYASASYDPGFYTSISGNSTVTIAPGSSATADLVVHDTSHQGALNLSFADSEGFSSTPSNITFSAPSPTISPPKGGATTVTVTVAALDSLKPGTYYAILTATDGQTYESSFLKIVVP